jgi:hypothetical protein
MCVSTLQTLLWDSISTQIYKTDSNGFFDFWIFSANSRIYELKTWVQRQEILFLKKKQKADGVYPATTPEKKFCIFVPFLIIA